MTLPEPLQPFAAYRQFMLYKLVQKPNTNKKDKLPVHPQTLDVTTAHDPATWVDAETAYATASLLGDDYGVAFVFTNDDPFFFVDVDGALQDNGEWSEVANQVAASFPGAAIELSQSGTGFHVFGSYVGHCPPHGCKNTDLGLELYHEGRFVALTGNQISGNASTDCTHILPSVIQTYFPPIEAGTTEDWRDTPVPEWSGPDDDDLLIKKMMTAKGSAAQVFGGNASFEDLWTANPQVLGKTFPPINPSDPFDRSSADASLAQRLAFWTGKNHQRMLDLMWRSALRRDKWKKHKNYLSMTIGNAVNKQREVYSAGGKKKEERQPTQPQNIFRIEAQLTSGLQFLTVTQMQELFAGCVYVQDEHRIFTPTGSKLKPDQFKATYGGYEFQMDNENNKTTMNAWEAFTENRAIRFPKVMTTCFDPKLPGSAIIEHEGVTSVNVYVPIDTPSTPGDAAPFLRHLAKLLPNQRDREIYLSYMAAHVQNPGKKFYWCPVMQGTEGNGKTLLFNCVAHAIGWRYSHLPNAQELAGGGLKFNGWMYGKLAICMEEIYIGERHSLTEAMKPLIGNDKIEIQRKGADQWTGLNTVNLYMFTNHKDAVPVNDNSRRYAIFYCAQQSKADLKRDGMTGEYFPSLYQWLKEENGYAIVNNYLRNYQIKDQFNPITDCHRAPMTSSTEEAVSLTMGGIEQEIRDAIEEDRPGFANGWISSAALARLLKELRAERRIPLNKRRSMLNLMGYDYHPYLRDGRVNTTIAAEGTKPKLFIKIGHIHANLTTASEIVAQYERAQGYPSGFATTAMTIDSAVNKV